MSELVPYEAFETDAEVEDVAVRLHDLVLANRELLHERNLLGPVSRYGGTVERAAAFIRKGQQDADPTHRLYVDDAGNIQGSTSVYRGLPLKRSRFGLPPALAPGPLSVQYAAATPNLHAWVANNDPEMLADAYGRLVSPYREQLGSLVRPRFSNERPWTLEPDKPQLASVHKAIAAAGLHRIATGRFNDNESRRHRPPITVLYGIVHARVGEKLPAYAQHPPKLRELKTGHKPLWRLDEEAEADMVSRNPRGV